MKKGNPGPTGWLQDLNCNWEMFDDVTIILFCRKVHVRLRKRNSEGELEKRKKGNNRLAKKLILKSLKI